MYPVFLLVNEDKSSERPRDLNNTKAAAAATSERERARAIVTNGWQCFWWLIDPLTMRLFVMLPLWYWTGELKPEYTCYARGRTNSNRRSKTTTWRIGRKSYCRKRILTTFAHFHLYIFPCVQGKSSLFRLVFFFAAAAAVAFFSISHGFTTSFFSSWWSSTVAKRPHASRSNRSHET